ncbi:MAG TPA: FAD-dependent oxidoreductase [Candidatus Dormibacteraeota bacterium]|nr:FAD-dependent oxidoreductase [Candidatus Dormibacteraeota bacterium]
MGCATAFFAQRAGLRTVVLEKRPALATLTTPVATGAFRLQFDNVEEVELVRESVAFFDELQQRVDIGLRHQGYLFVARTDDGAVAQRNQVAMQRGWGLDDVELLDSHEARRRFPYLAGDIVNARFRRADGWLEPRRLALELARASGARFEMDRPVTGFLRQGEAIRGVTTAAGTVAAQTVVIAAGPLSGPLAGLADLDLPLTTVRRHKLIVPDLPQVPATAPMTIEYETGAHWRPAGSGAHALWTAPAPAEPPLDDVPTSSDFAFGLLDPASHHALARVAPFWKEVWGSSRLQWWLQAGQYTYTPDRRPLLGPTEIPGLALNTGYSGHGIMGSIGGSRRAVDAITGSVKPQDNPFKPDRPMKARTFDVL